ncbi:AIPR family protein [Pseudenhygromyxa sp. WMMC2535]|uniref:AIPR family protein n=1 Tax=Pseudenhygromyxa sp. WMMC2535 TaxID=2712867 RepID=UPI00155723A8|nr:AIPR family protein [Pseudenhygromyxa sp. WMMC2535]
MNVNASIIESRVSGHVDALRQRFADELKISGDAAKLKSTAFTCLCVETILDLDVEDALDSLVEGSQDFGVDAIHAAELLDGEFVVTLFQSKYKQSLDGRAGFPATGIEKLAQAARYLFDPGAQLPNINQRLRARVEDIRSMIRDGAIPQIRIIACNNGKRWESDADTVIANTGFGAQVSWEHVNHDTLVSVLQATKPVNDNLVLTGKAMVEDMHFSRVLTGRISAAAIFDLIDKNGERLLERNIRRHLGIQGNRVNEAIQSTLMGDDAANFYFYNNGITLTCDKFAYNALQDRDYRVQVENLQIVNGGQTCMTIYRTISSEGLSQSPASVLVRLYELPKDNDDLVHQITYATNSQNPVDLRDLRANDELQRRLELGLDELGFRYRRKRSDHAARTSDITSGAAAQAVLAVWRHRPHQAKFYSREHFGKLYAQIFRDDLSAEQVALAVLIYRKADSRRRRPLSTDPEHVRYASAFIAMQMGRRILAKIGPVALGALTRQVYERARAELEQRGDEHFDASVLDISSALKSLYGDRSLSLQQLSATFRRGDLINRLLELPPPT